MRQSNQFSWNFAWGKNQVTLDRQDSLLTLSHKKSLTWYNDDALELCLLKKNPFLQGFNHYEMHLDTIYAVLQSTCGSNNCSLKNMLIRR